LEFHPGQDNNRYGIRKYHCRPGLLYPKATIDFIDDVYEIKKDSL
jgi:hypothetical protein